MKRFLSVLCVCLTCGPLQASGSDWLSGIHDSAFLFELAIPGTHNSGAVYNEPFPGTALCQDLTIAEQLSAGVRYLDIRCKRYDNGFRIYHGTVSQGINFDDVLTDCADFLAAHPTEAIMMSVKEEDAAYNSSLTFEQIFNNYVSQNPDLWNLDTAIPQLGEARGRILLLRRFGATTAMGLNATAWANNTTFTINGPAPMRVQDYYDCSDGASKWNAVTDLLAEAEAGGTSTLYLNYTSGYKAGLFGIPSIPAISDYVNPRLAAFFDDNPLGRFGVIVTDFMTEALSEKIYQANFDDSGYDLNNFADLAAAWLTASGQIDFNARYDLDDSGYIDSADLQLFANNWLW